MTVNYYSINGCKYEILAGKPVIIAPENADEAELEKYDFTNLDDGRWIRWLNKVERNYIASMMKAEQKEISITAEIASSEISADTDLESDNKTANNLCLVSLTMVILCLMAVRPEGSSPFILLAAMSAFIIMIYVRKKYPKNIFAKILMVLYIIGFVLATLIISLWIMFITSRGGSCNDWLKW